MSIKSTKTITREQAISILVSEIGRMTEAGLAFELTQISDRQMEDMLDRMADSGKCETISIFDNFLIDRGLEP